MGDKLVPDFGSDWEKKSARIKSQSLSLYHTRKKKFFFFFFSGFFFCCFLKFCKFKMDQNTAYQLFVATYHPDPNVHKQAELNIRNVSSIY